jgi:hypothetical protein
MSQRIVVLAPQVGKGNAGFQEAAIAITHELRDGAVHASDVSFNFFRVPLDEEWKNASIPSSGGIHYMGQTSQQLPLDKSLYGSMPDYQPELVDYLLDGATSVQFVGVGETTMEPLLLSQQKARKAGLNVKSHFVSHMIHTATDLQKLVANDVSLFVPKTQDDLAKLDKPTARLAVEKGLLQRTTSVPHMNIPAVCAAHFDTYAQTQQGREAIAMLETGQPFAFMVVNAGISLKNDPTRAYAPYMAKEAEEHGFELGKRLRKDAIDGSATNLILTHGGPRNLRDEDEFKQFTTKAFVRGYQKGQGKKGSKPHIIVERFGGQPYDMIKVGFHMCRPESPFAQNCRVFGTNAEGDGTMAGAVGMLDNDVTPIIMIPFQAVREVSDRVATMKRMFRSGIDMFDVTNYGSPMWRQMQNRPHTPLAGQNPARQIVQYMGF